MLGTTFYPRRARLLLSLAVLPLVAACTIAGVPMGTSFAPAPAAPAAASPSDDFVAPLAYAAPEMGNAAGLNAAIGRYAALYEVPESLIRRVIVRESSYNPAARHGPYWGLMQIRYDTARSMGYDGAPGGLLDPDINLRFGVRYLAGAYRVAGGNPDKAMSFYASGYYYDARRMGLLEAVGLKRGKS
ncbi:MAG: lytic transglycosylase domain-containing protein [Devosia sp.]|nr:lytic transglycosylase domain-containing protein [Devosia sp.]